MDNGIKSFEEIWQEISSKKEVVELLEYNVRNDKIRKWVFPAFVAICIIMWIVTMVNPFYLFIVFGTILVITLMVCFTKYRDRINKPHPEYLKYKEIGDKFVTTPIAEEFFQNVIYSSEDKITVEEYRNGFRMFNESKKYFEAEYLLTGQVVLANNIISNFKMSNVMHGDGAGENNEQGEMIYGDVIIIDLPVKINTNIILESKVNTEQANISKYNSFDEIYDISSKNSEEIGTIITDEIRQTILDLVNKYKCIFEISINGNKLYIRFNQVEILFNLTPDKEQAKKFYDGLVKIKDILVNVANVFIETIGGEV